MILPIRSYFGESTQPVGPLCLWQCSIEFVFSPVYQTIIIVFACLGHSNVDVYFSVSDFGVKFLLRGPLETT